MNFPCATEIPFAAFNGKYTGRSCHVVGRGPTDFDFEQLGKSSDPVFFINDAVCLEKHVQSDSFFFAHDPQMLGWLDGRIKSTAVLPIDGKIFAGSPAITLHHAGPIVFYHWNEPNREAQLKMTRDELAIAAELFTHTGTIHSLLHFVWYCGFTKVNLIGCDCINDTSKLADQFQTPDGYDPRLENLSGSASSHNYGSIGNAQNLLIMLFGLEAAYLGTPGRKLNGSGE
jgi:hypothetical protein